MLALGLVDQRRLLWVSSPLVLSLSSSLAQKSLYVCELFLHFLVNVAVNCLSLVLHCRDLVRQLCIDLGLLCVLLLHCVFKLLEFVFHEL